MSAFANSGSGQFRHSRFFLVKKIGECSASLCSAEIGHYQKIG